MLREKQIPLCVPRPPNCGGPEKARDSVRDDTRLEGRTNCGPPGLTQCSSAHADWLGRGIFV